MNDFKYTREAIGGAAIFFSMLVWVFFLSQTNLKIRTLVGLNGIDELIGVFLNISFVLFALFFPLTIALVSCFTKAFEKKFVFAQVIVSFVLFSGISWLLFENLRDFWVAGLAYFAALLIIVESSSMKFNELKTLPFLRVSLSAMGQANLLIGIAVFAATALFVLPIQNTVVEELEEKTINSIAGKDTQKILSDTLSNIFVLGEKKSALEIVATEEFLALTQKDDPQSTAFVAKVSEKITELESEEHADEIAQQFSAGIKSQFGTNTILETFKSAKKQVPLIQTFEQTFWLFTGMIAASMYLLAGNFLFKPLSAIYGFILGLFIENLDLKKTSDE